jgi:Ribonuclease HII
MPDYLLEHEARLRGANIICGVDEVGRGPLAGPVMAAAAIIPLNENGQPTLPGDLLTQLNDSKKLSAKKREAIFEPLIQSVDYATAEITSEEIDEINILQATSKP